MSDPSNHQERLHADLDVVERWLRIIHPPGAIMHISSKGSWAGRRFVDYNAATQHVAELDRSGTEGVYLRPTPLKLDTPSGGRGRAIDAATLPCLWGDIDIAGPGHAETNLPPDEPSALSTIAHLPEPTYVVRSGGGIYPIWMLAPAMELTGPDQYRAAAELSERWNQAIAWGHERYGWKYGTGVHDLARVLRLPGTVNRKAGLERPTSFLNGGGRYDMRDLVIALQQHEAEHAAKIAPRVTSATPIHSYNAATMNPGERPGDVYNREAPWEDALGPDFVKICDRPDGSAEWAWADDPAREVKLTTDRDGKNNAFFFTTSWTLTAQEPHSKFYVYAHRVHAGDLSAATKDVANRFGSDVRRDDDFFSQYEPVGQLGMVGDVQPGQPTSEQRRAEQQHDAVASLDDDFLSVEDLANLEPPVPIIDNILMRHSIGILNGRGGSYKSFLALDWALCMATGKSWQGKRVERARVDYVAGEGAHGLKQRIDAWRSAWPTETDLSWFRVLPYAPNFLRDAAKTAALIRSVEKNGTGLVVIDTLRRISGGADENGTKDMGPIWDRLTTLRRATDRGSVLVVAHTPKDGRETTRGASSIEDDSDTIWHVKKDGKAITLSCLKMKDAEEPSEMHLSVREVPGASGGKGSLVIESQSRSGAFLSTREQGTLSELADWGSGYVGPSELATTTGRDRAGISKDLTKLADRELVASDGKYHAKYKITEAGSAYLETGTFGIERSNDRVATMRHDSQNDQF